jgi:hypothetical protein
MITYLAKWYTIRDVGDSAENVETAIKHGMTSLRGTEEIPALKRTSLYSTYRFRLVQPCFWLPHC